MSISIQQLAGYPRFLYMYVFFFRKVSFILLLVNVSLESNFVFSTSDIHTKLSDAKRSHQNCTLIAQFHFTLYTVQTQYSTNTMFILPQTKLTQCS